MNSNKFSKNKKMKDECKFYNPNKKKKRGWKK